MAHHSKLQIDTKPVDRTAPGGCHNDDDVAFFAVLSARLTTLIVAPSSASSVTGSPSLDDAREKEYQDWIQGLVPEDRMSLANLTYMSRSLHIWYYHSCANILIFYEIMERAARESGHRPPEWLLRSLYHPLTTGSEVIVLGEHSRNPMVMLPLLLSRNEIERQELISISDIRLLVDALVTPWHGEETEVKVQRAGFDRLIKSFYLESFEGDAVVVFQRFLDHKERQFKDQVPLYGRSVPIVQSSGLGKSRMIHELSSHNDYFVLSICLRRPDPTGSNGFPPGDTVVAQFLTSLTSDQPRPAYERLYACFFKAYFEQAAERLEKCSTNSQKHVSWTELSIPPLSETPTEHQLNTWLVNTRLRYLSQVVEQATRYWCSGQAYDAIVTKTKVAAARLSVQLPGDAKFLVAIDEASILAKNAAASQPRDFTSLAMRRVWMEIGTQRMWLVLMDTNNALYHLAPPVEDSGRLASKKLIPVLTSHVFS